MPNDEKPSVPERKESEPDLAPSGPKQKAKCREKEEKSPSRASTTNGGEFSKMEKREDNKKINNSARREMKMGKSMMRTSRPSALTPSTNQERSRAASSDMMAPVNPRQFVVRISKDETELASLQLEGELAIDCKAMEEYKVAIQQVHNQLIMLMRRGNDTTDYEMIKSERGQAAAEKLNKEVLQTENFWKTDTKLQPAMNDSIAKNTSILGQVERNLQEKGPTHLKRIRKFVYSHYPRYVEMKKELAKIVKQQRPDSQELRDECIKKISTFVKEKYTTMKAAHVGEIQSAFVEISFYHHASSYYWYQIAERKVPKNLVYQPDTFDFKQFFQAPPKGL